MHGKKRRGSQTPPGTPARQAITTARLSGPPTRESSIVFAPGASANLLDTPCDAATASAAESASTGTMREAVAHAAASWGSTSWFLSLGS